MSRGIGPPANRRRRIMGTLRLRKAARKLRAILAAAVLVAALVPVAGVRPAAADFGGLGFDVTTVSGIPQAAVYYWYNQATNQWVFFKFDGWSYYGDGTYTYLATGGNYWLGLQSVWWDFGSSTVQSDGFVWAYGPASSGF
jgi:hypothetical protein